MTAAWTRYLPVFIRQRLEGRPALQQVVGNTGWLFANNLLRMGVGLLVNIWVTRYLGPEQFGLLSYATAFVFVFSSIAAMGLDWVVVRNIVRDPSCRDETLGTAFMLKLAAGAITLGLTLAAIFIVRPADHLTRLLVAIVALGIVFQAFGTINFWFQSQVQSKYSVLVKSVAFLIVSAAKITLIWFEAPLVAFAWAGLAEIVLGSAGLVAAYRFQGHFIKTWRATWAMAKVLLRDCWPLMLTDIVMLAYMRIDQVILGEIAGNTEVGIYSAAVLLAETWLFIPMAVTSSLFPSVVEARESDETLFHDRLQKYYNLMAFLGYAIALPVSIVANWIVPFLFGAAYAKAGPMLTGLIWAGLFINLSVARSSYLTVMNWTRIHFIADLLGCALNITLNLILIPRFGGMGAVIASLVAYWAVAHGSCFLFKPLFKTGSMLTKAMLYPKFW
ncbi:MAG: flippase [Geobacter sp.]|nr:MAG: flippase [Geobacter sp.]